MIPVVDLHAKSGLGAKFAERTSIVVGPEELPPTNVVDGPILNSVEAVRT
jgi:hypothetical protein